MPDFVKLEKEMEQLLQNSALRPEAQISVFRRFMAQRAVEINNSHKAMVDLVNSLGVQFRQDSVEHENYREEINKNSESTLKYEHLNEVPDWPSLLKIIRQMPKEWSLVQISRAVEPVEIIRQINELHEGDPTLIFTRFACGENADRIEPFTILVPPRGVPTGTSIVGRIREILSSRYLSRKMVNKRHWEIKQKSNELLTNCVMEFETYSLRGWKCLLNGKLEDSKLESDLIDELRKLLLEMKLKNYSNLSEEQVLNLVYLLTLTAHNLKDHEMYNILKKVLSNEEIDDAHNISNLSASLKILNGKKNLKTARRHPLILILDNSFEIIPWEMCSPMLNQPVTRINSLHLLLALYKAHEEFMADGFRQVQVCSVYSLINPSKDLKNCEERIGEFVDKNIPWCEVVKGNVPNHLPKKISECSLYIYCGHGSGTHFLVNKELYALTLTKGVHLLFGCSSNGLHNQPQVWGTGGEEGAPDETEPPPRQGSRVPFASGILALFVCGCPAIVGALYDVDSNDVDRATIALLKTILPTLVNGGNGDLSLKDPVDPNLLRAIHQSKNACQKYWTKASFIARGLPIRFIVTEEDKTSILNKIKKPN